MKFNCILFISLIYCLKVFGQTTIPEGNLSGTLNVAGSPYTLQGIVKIPNDSTLTIEPGVTIFFQDNTSLMRIEGRLLAVGTETDSITFMAADTTLGWSGLQFDSIPTSADSSKLIYCKLQYGSGFYGSPRYSSVIFVRNFSKLEISNCLISKNYVFRSGGGIYCVQSSPLISMNTITSNFSIYAPSGIWISNGNPIIRDNNIINNTCESNGAGIVCNQSTASIIHNIISYNTSFAMLGPTGRGGGISASQSTLIIDSNEISNNIAKDGLGGGGLYFEACNLTITNNNISNNSAVDGQGGGIYCYGGQFSIMNNIISNNLSSTDSAGTVNFYSGTGGGIHFNQASGTLSHNIIAGNIAIKGGAICFAGSGGVVPTISDNNISDNTSSIYGGGIYCDHYSPIIKSNLISNNTSGGGGGGIYCDESSPPMKNNIICNNSANYGGGIVCYSFNSNSNAEIESNTIANNFAQEGGGLWCEESSPQVRNTILFGNTSVNGGDQVHLNHEDSDPNFYYCNIQEDSSGFGRDISNPVFTGAYQNNIDVDPFFNNPTSGSGSSFNGTLADWSLQGLSNCIDAGDPAGTYPSTDIAGNPRVVNIIDIGAYEAVTTNVKNISAQSDIIYFPNPFNDYLTVDFSELKKITVKIIDLFGEEIKVITTSSKQLIVPRGELKPGIYELQFVLGMGVVINKKVAVQ